MAKRKQAPKKAKAPKVFQFCACGCGGKTKGGSFKMGHDQRLRGLLKRGETLRAVTLAFLKEQNKTSEWIKLRLRARKSAPVRARRKMQESVQAEAVKAQPVRP